ncbi:MAG TPA: sigma-70 family RNA polymerase sigma factor [Daejeonella sp.]|uniref:sigma-70 family RNA polymerase sigma factor n=1 Tax=Daejeonella sp. TaxID=2805397 RepID=UPI002EDA70D3
MPTEKGLEAGLEDLSILDPKKWVERYADYLFRYAILRIHDQDLAKDLVQETFLAGLKSLSGFAGKSSERTWLTAILKYKIIDLYRKESSGLANIKDLKQEEASQDDFFYNDNGHWKKEYAPRPFEELADPLRDKEFNRILQDCMKKLPKLWASVFTLKHMDDEKTEVILDELRLSKANFWVIIHRTKLSLRACLQKNWL